jgi:hypothetical protein
MSDDTATPKLRFPCWAWNVSGAYVEVTRTGEDNWIVHVSEGGCTDRWEIVWDETADTFRSIGSPNEDREERGFWNLCPFICSEYEPCYTAGRLL